jgi:hypothetical protein
MVTFRTEWLPNEFNGKGIEEHDATRIVLRLPIQNRDVGGRGRQPPIESAFTVASSGG